MDRVRKLNISQIKKMHLPTSPIFTFASDTRTRNHPSCELHFMMVKDFKNMASNCRVVFLQTNCEWKEASWSTCYAQYLNSGDICLESWSGVSDNRSSFVFWGVTLFSQLKDCRHFGGKYYLYLQGLRESKLTESQARSMQQAECLAYCSTMKMGGLRSSETSMNFYILRGYL
jgi:hypothetical protein